MPHTFWYLTTVHTLFWVQMYALCLLQCNLTISRNDFLIQHLIQSTFNEYHILITHGVPMNRHFRSWQHSIQHAL